MHCADRDDEADNTKSEWTYNMKASFTNFIRVTEWELRCQQKSEKSRTHCERKADTMTVKMKGGAHNTKDMVEL